LGRSAPLARGSGEHGDSKLSSKLQSRRTQPVSSTFSICLVRRSSRERLIFRPHASLYTTTTAPCSFGAPSHFPQHFCVMQIPFCASNVPYSPQTVGVYCFRFVTIRREAVHFSQAFLKHDNPGDHAICVLGFVLSRRDRAKSWEVRRLSPQPSFSLPALPAAAGGTHGPGRSTRTIPPSPAEDDVSDAF
jgi:hypothetical protein